MKALLFDVFGTLVDWRSGVAREAEAVLKPRGYALDWPALANAWRGEYQGAMEEVRSGRIRFCKLDVLHRRNLDRILPRFGLGALGDEERRALNLAWHRLDAWPDVTAGLARLRRNYLLAPLSNGNVSIMVDLARRNDFPWDAILGAEFAGDYKPKPRVYLSAAEAFDLAAAGLPDGGGAQQRSCRRRGARLAHRPYRAAERGRTGSRRDRADCRGRYRGEQHRGFGGAARRVRDVTAPVPRPENRRLRRAR